jgi:hypothetical protein
MNARLEGTGLARDSVLGMVHGSMIRRWLEIVLPVYAIAFLVVLLQPTYAPAFLSERPSDTLLPWLGWAVVGAMTGILMLWAVILMFFLVYSPIYLIQQVPTWFAGNAWVDKRELGFYTCCFLLLAMLVCLLVWDPEKALIAFLMVSGLAPAFCRYIV